MSPIILGECVSNYPGLLFPIPSDAVCIYPCLGLFTPVSNYPSHRQPIGFLGYFLYSLIYFYLLERHTTDPKKKQNPKKPKVGVSPSLHICLFVYTRPAQTSHSKCLKFCTYPPREIGENGIFCFSIKIHFLIKKLLQKRPKMGFFDIT